MSVTTPSTGQKISDFSAGNVDANSYFIQANSGSTSKVSASQIGQFSNLNLLFSGAGGLDTTAKTIVGAINEVNAKDASDIVYDNTSSGLTATDVQAAIDEVNRDLNNSVPSYIGSSIVNSIITSYGQSYTVPTNGWVYLSNKANDSSTANGVIYLDGRQILNVDQKDKYGLVVWLPVKKGQVISSRNLANSGEYYCYLLI